MIFQHKQSGGKAHERTEKSYLEGGIILTRKDVDRLSGSMRETMTSFTIPEWKTALWALKSGFPQERLLFIK